MSKYNEALNQLETQETMTDENIDEVMKRYHKARDIILEAIDKANEYDLLLKQLEVETINRKRILKENKELKEQISQLEFDDKLKCELYEKTILENQILKDFALYCINEIHKWGFDYYGKYTNQKLIDNISGYLNEKGIKTMVR